MEPWKDGGMRHVSTTAPSDIRLPIQQASDRRPRYSRQQLATFGDCSFSPSPSDWQSDRRPRYSRQATLCDCSFSPSPSDWRSDRRTVSISDEPPSLCHLLTRESPNEIRT
ncbi:hypothetical protein SDJN03_14664, partial [Cucurbita argyrosperma subsp. sororia]